ncbi:hypothetical protein BUALT_BualtUnG0059500 [Buddleja alternifolia]|uniref:LOB domain-containing protein n=1 Tax=Buddleja alternifolia TaxID=168488 RepID=A0AAV6W0R0_9LAMI|nr:hypothetical protein BUALT_BualtUnG0059500 [Buddleja alternifolia]
MRRMQVPETAVHRHLPPRPYFPANQPKMFQNVHRLFGVSSITKTLKSLKNKDQRDDAMKSIIYEAEMRERFPVYGCSVIICQLRLQLQYVIDEFKYVHSQLAVHREQLKKPQEQPWEIGNEMPINVNTNFMNESNGFYDSLSNNLTAIQAQINAFGFNDREILYQNYEAAPFNASDDRASYVETKDACHSRIVSESKANEQEDIRQVGATKRKSPNAELDEASLLELYCQSTDIDLHSIRFDFVLQLDSTS